MAITNPWMTAAYQGETAMPDYASIMANSAMIPGLGYIPNSMINQDSRGSWIGAPSATSTNPMASTQYNPGLPDNNHPNGVYAGQYDPNYGMSSASTAAPTLKGYEASPYLAQMASGLRDQFTSFMNDGLAANRGNAVANGNVGSSRQGIAEARTMTDAGKGFDNAITNLYGTDYTNSMNRNLQQYGMDQNYALGNRSADLGFLNSGRSYDLGMGGLANQRYGMDQSFYTAQRGQDQSGALLGANLYNMGMQGMWNPLQNASGIYNSTAGNNVTNTTGGTVGGGWTGGLGGALGTAQLASNLKWW